MTYTPHDYQQYASDFIEEHPVAAVLLQMGLGKTVITLTALSNLLFDSFLVRKVLIIAPLRVARDTWPAEIGKWDHLGDLIPSVAVGSTAERITALERKADLYIINRENVQWLIEESALPFDFDMVVVDELSSFKNHRSKRFRALMKRRPVVKRIVGLTGTPASNGLIDLWAQFKILDKGVRLGRFIGAYRNAYFTPDKRSGQVVFSYKPAPGAEERIYQAIEDITISMKAQDHIRMPELVTNEYKISLSGDERMAYERLRKDLVLDASGGQVTAANAASLSGKLLQLANGAVYTDDGKTIALHDRKLDALEDLIEAANGKSVLVAYWFKHDLQRIAGRLEKLGVSFSTLDSSESLLKWNQGKLQAALIHPASAGHGLNLQGGGSFLIWFGLTWSLELYQQTVARLWRQGQKSETVVVQHLITEKTIDERIIKVLSGKALTQNALIEAVKAELTGGSR
ncbi:DNA/RNA helicase, superfamily II, SNF2 family [Sphaerochaeta pleomorpha str. Grapes]|uniref:DNA/RNA helicase, superfamily II, SNF2 family n=1 Tax=Sphaerochaeta pleomorpha (strain ATCC BAA-1885 / DSM 22778 / Grapes) TaxID=158190 RepID=G8QWM5_SPHPG|nr:DEAD/DEAH box helicase [Sphaerochaeta pleomorpha]AEV30601.1 DNA/RNA helicase, superfamily II, SNF2 family [Sphaerochaeta pleomorpha str. Grapes]